MSFVRWRTAALCLSTAFWASSVRAEAAGGVHTDTFQYTSQESKHYVRAALEELGILGLGTLHYYGNRDANSVDWDLDYDWPSFRQKLDGRAYAFDTNHFETNFLSHPAAGTLYYLAARGNRLSPFAALGYATASSTVWEFFGEFRERVSVNDMIVTPLSGFIFGEALTQLGSFFDRGCATGGNRALGSLFGFSKSFHDALDGAALNREQSCDSHGFARTGRHDFTLRVGPSTVWQLQGQRKPYVEAQERLSLSVENLPTLGVPGRHIRGFADGNLAQLDAVLAAGHLGWTDLQIGASVVPVGFHYRNIPWAVSDIASGEEAIFGAYFGVLYSAHVYDRSAEAVDQVFVLDAPAASLRYRLHRGPRVLEFALDAGGSFAGVEAFALEAYTQTMPKETLTTIAGARGYNYALGAMLAPRVRLHTVVFDFSVAAKAHRYFALRALDRVHTTPSKASTVEGEREVSTRFDFHPPSLPVAFYAQLEARQRLGAIESVRNSRSELALGAGIAGAL